MKLFPCMVAIETRSSSCTNVIIQKPIKSRSWVVSAAGKVTWSTHRSHKWSRPLHAFHNIVLAALSLVIVWVVKAVLTSAASRRTVMYIFPCNNSELFPSNTVQEHISKLSFIRNYTNLVEMTLTIQKILIKRETCKNRIVTAMHMHTCTWTTQAIIHTIWGRQF